MFQFPNLLSHDSTFLISLPSEPGAPRQVDWAKPDLDIYTMNKSKLGWCNVDPAEGYANKVKFKEECDCKYDCLSGRFCEVPVQCSCINQCSGHGHCRGGFCQVMFVLSLIMIPESQVFDLHWERNK